VWCYLTPATHPISSILPIWLPCHLQQNKINK
jgi:hypothetical protein